MSIRFHEDQNATTTAAAAAATDDADDDDGDADDDHDKAQRRQQAEAADHIATINDYNDADDVNNYNSDHVGGIGAGNLLIYTVTNSYNYNYTPAMRVRLRGGAGENVRNIDDVLRVDVLDEPEDAKSKDKDKDKEAATIDTDGQTVCELTKMIIFISIWIIFTWLLIANPVSTWRETYLAVPPGDEVTRIVPPVLKVNNSMSLYLKGPFYDHAEMSAMPHGANITLKVQALLITTAQGLSETLYAAPVWQVPIREYPDYNRVNKHSHIFALDRMWSNGSGIALYIEFVHNSNEAIALQMKYDETPVDKEKGMVYGVIVLIFLYTLIVWEIINRTLASIMAALLSISILAALGSRPSLETIMNWIDRETLMLLFGMMILVAILSESGVFDYLAVYAYEITGGHIWPLINTLCFFTATLSAFLDNVTMMLLVTPVTIRLCEVTKVSPVPVLICMVIFSNLGAAATPVGDPPNVIICMNPYIAQHDVTFNEFALHMVPGILLACIQTYIQLRFIYRKPSSFGSAGQTDVEDLKREINIWEKTASGLFDLSKDEANFREKLLMKVKTMKTRLGKAMVSDSPNSPMFAETLDRLKAQYPIRSKRLLYQSCVAFALVILLFITHSVPDLHHLSLGWAALIGALMLLIIADIDDLDAIISRVEWPTLLFFASLFIVMESLTIMGLIDVIGQYVVSVIMLVNPEYRLAAALVLICWVSAIASAFLNNIPVTTMMIKIVISLAENNELRLPLHPMIWALAFGVCFGGNGTMIGASANVVCAGVIEQHGYKFGFVDFSLVAFPVMLGSVLVASIYILVAHVAFTWHTT